MHTLPTALSSTTHDQLQPSVAAKQAAFTEQDRELISRKFIRLMSILKIILEEESNAKSKGTTEKANV
jgi:hypothetical protein